MNIKASNLKQLEHLCPGITPYIENAALTEWSWVKTEKGEPNLRSSQGLYLYDQKGAHKEMVAWFKKIAPFDKQVLFIHGIGLGLAYDVLKDWLKINPRRFLVIMDDDPVILARFLETERAHEILHDHQVIFRFFPSPKLAGWGVFRGIFEWICNAFCSINWEVVSSPFYAKNYPEETLLVGNQIRSLLRIRGYYFSDRVESFNQVYRNFFRNIPLIADSYKVPPLYGQFKDIPCVICGAGPSLNKLFAQIKDLENKALILGAATGFNVLNRAGIYPHFGLCIDPFDIQESRQLTHFGYETPFFYQWRFYYKATPLIHGPKIYIGSLNFEKLALWFNQEFQLPAFKNVEMGFSTSNVFAYLAVELGCNPIVFTGIDLAYQDKTRYAEGLGRHGTDVESHAKHDAEVSQDTLQTQDAQGKDIQTKWVWLEEGGQFSQLVRSNPKLKFYNSSVGGLNILDIPYVDLKMLGEQFTRSYDLINWIHAELQLCEQPKVSHAQVEKALNKWKSLTEEALEKLLALKSTPPEERENVMGEFAQTTIYQSFLQRFDEIYLGLNAPDLVKLKFYPEQFSPEVLEQGMTQAFESRLAMLSTFLRQSLIFIDEGIEVAAKLKKQPGGQPSAVLPSPVHLKEDLAHDEMFTLKYPDGSIKGEMPYLKGKLNGICTFYSPQGKVLGKSRFVQDKRVGQTLQYDLDGHLSGILTFNDEGLRDGKHQFFYPDGKIKSEIPYKNGLIDGEVMLYYPSGQLKRSLSFVGGKLEGTERMWNEAGVLTTEANYKNNLPSGTTRTWHDNGQLSKEMIFYTSSLDYDISLWDEQGHLVHKSTTLPPEPLAALREKSQALLESIQKMEAQLKDLKDKPS